MNLRTILPVSILLCLTTAARAQGIDAVEVEIQGKFKELKSVSAKTKISTVMEMPGYAMRSTIEGTYQMMNEGGLAKFRQETRSSSETDIGGQKTTQKSEDLSISDGKDMYSVVKNEQGVQATHMRAQKADAKPFDALRDTHMLKLLPEEKVDGKDCFVIEATMKDPQMAAMAGKSVSWYHKDTGFLLKTVAYSPDGKPTMTMEYTEVKFNEEIPADRFRWDPKLAQGAAIQELGA